LPIELNRNGLRTVALGTGKHDELNLPFLPNNADIEADDSLVTSGLGGAFPPGYPVATITSVIRNPQEPFAEVTAQPIASLDRVRELMLIWNESDDTESEESEDE